MNKKGLAALAAATALSLLGVAAAQAGGFSRGTADTDILFEQGNFNVRTSITVVSPERKIVSGPSNVDHDYADTYGCRRWLPSSASRTICPVQAPSRTHLERLRLMTRRAVRRREFHLESSRKASQLWNMLRPARSASI